MSSLNGFIVEKIGMTQVFDDSGLCLPVTVLRLLESEVTQVKTEEKDGYTAIQVGYGVSKEKHLSKPEQGHLKNASQLYRHLYEFDFVDGISVGDKLSPAFEVGQFISLRGTTKGKGTQGGVKRWGHKRGLMTHGSKSHRAPGSIGAGTTPGRVFKGLKTAGRMGGTIVTQPGLEVVKFDAEKGILLVKGSVPGPSESVLIGRKAA